MNNDDFRRLILGPRPTAADAAPPSAAEVVDDATAAESEGVGAKATRVSWPELLGYDGRMVALAIRSDRPDVRVITVLEQDLSGLEAELALQLDEEGWEARALPLTVAEGGGTELVVLLVVRACHQGREADCTVARIPWVAWRRWQAPVPSSVLDSDI
jgi:hypothetical protein